MEKESIKRLEKLEILHKRLRFIFFVLLLVMFAALCIAFKQAQHLKLL